jgi:hypothetical protein
MTRKTSRPGKPRIGRINGLPLTVRGGRQRVPDHAGSWMPAARVGSSACGLFSRGRWVERADGPASCPHPQRVPRLRVCLTPCLGSVLHAHKLLHQFLAARPCPAGALRSASSVASAFVSVSSSSGAHHVGIRLQAALSSPPRAAPAAPAACPQPPVLATPGSAGRRPPASAPGSAGWRGRAAEGHGSEGRRPPVEKAV